MRIALITLAVAALAFIGSIIWIFAEKNGIDLLGEPKATTVKISSETASIEILRSQWKTEDRIKELEAKIDALGGKTPVDPTTPLPQTVQNTGSTSTGTTANIIPISAKFLTKVISKVNLTLAKNNGIYGLYIFDTSTEYSTYIDTKFGMSIVASRTPYSTWMENFQAVDKSLFTVNESKTFPFPSFYLNPPKDDGTVRIVMQVEAQTLMISLVKSRFTEFKTLMTKK